VAAAIAYFDAFLEQKLDLVPWGYPCNRTEGGIHTGKGVPEDSCQVGVPGGVNIVARRFIIDETLRFVHTLTHVPEGRIVGRGGQGRGRGPDTQK